MAYTTSTIIILDSKPHRLHLFLIPCIRFQNTIHDDTIVSITKITTIQCTPHQQLLPYSRYHISYSHTVISHTDGPVLGLQHPLAVLNGPRQLLARGQHLAKGPVHHYSRILGSNSTLILVRLCSALSMHKSYILVLPVSRAATRQMTS